MCLYRRPDKFYNIDLWRKILKMCFLKINVFVYCQKNESFECANVFLIHIVMNNYVDFSKKRQLCCKTCHHCRVHLLWHKLDYVSIYQFIIIFSLTASTVCCLADSYSGNTWSGHCRSPFSFSIFSRSTALAVRSSKACMKRWSQFRRSGHGSFPSRWKFISWSQTSRTKRTSTSSMSMPWNPSP